METKYKFNIGDEVLYKNYISEIVGISMVASDEPPMYFIETKMGGSIMQEWVYGSEIKLPVEEEIKLENNDKLYAIRDINGGSTFLKDGGAFKKMLINDILEDTRELAYYEVYESLGIAITRLNIVIMDIDDAKLSKIVIHIANEYGYEVYDLTKTGGKLMEELTKKAIAKMWKLEHLDKQLSEDDKCSALYQEKMEYERKLDRLIKKMEEKKQMKFKVGDEVRFESDEQTGIGVIVDIDVLDILPYLIHSEDIVRGNNGAVLNDKFKQDNDNNWWFQESSLMKLVESCDDTDEVDMVNEPLHYNLGTIQTLDYIDDVLIHNPNLTALDGYYLGNIIKYLSTRLGTKADKIQDMQKAQFYLNRRVKIEEESE